MSNRLFASKKSKVIPFEQNGEFYHKKARKYIESNNYIEALNYYRKAVESHGFVRCFLFDISVAPFYNPIIYPTALAYAFDP